MRGGHILVIHRPTPLARGNPFHRLSFLLLDLFFVNCPAFDLRGEPAAQLGHLFVLVCSFHLSGCLGLPALKTVCEVLLVTCTLYHPSEDRLHHNGNQGPSLRVSPAVLRAALSS